MNDDQSEHAMTAIDTIRPRTEAPATVADRREPGRSARERPPRSTMASREPAGDRDPVDVLERQAATREPSLVPLRYGRMLASPFASVEAAPR